MDGATFEPYIPVVVVVDWKVSQSIELGYGLPTRLSPRTAVLPAVVVYPRFADAGVYQSCTVTWPTFNVPVAVIVTLSALVPGLYLLARFVVRSPLNQNRNPLPAGILKLP